MSSVVVLFDNMREQENHPRKRMKISDSVVDQRGKLKALDSVVNEKISVKQKENCEKKNEDDGNGCDGDQVLGLNARIHNLSTLPIVKIEDVDGRAAGDNKNNQAEGQSDDLAQLSRDLTNHSLKNIQVESILGEGGFAKVYLVKQGPARKVCALKFRPFRPNESQIKKEKIEFEFVLQHRMNHGNLVRAFESVKMPHACCFLMELCPKGSLLDYVCGNAFPKRDNRSKRYVINIIDGLVYLHEQMGYLHMDLKLENILVSENDVAKISDFGCAVKMISFRTLMKMSQYEGGTRTYSPPEILRKEGFDSTIDVWALGCIGHEVMLWRHPFYQGSVESDLHCRTGSMKDGDGLAQMDEALNGRLFTDYNQPRSRHLKRFLESILSRPKNKRPLSFELKSDAWFH